MNTVIRNLSILFVIQAALVAFVQLRSDGLAHFNASEALVTTNISASNVLNIQSADKNLALKKNADGKWTIQDASAFPANQSKVEGIFRFVADAKRGWPVGQTTAATKQFKVSDKVFERKINFQDADKVLATVYLGDSPGFRKTYVRTSTDNNTYTLEFPIFEASVNTKDWYDPSYLHVDPSNITEVSLNDVVLSREASGTLSIPAIPEGKELNTTEANSFLRATSELRFVDVLGQEDKAEYQSAQPVLSFVITQKGDKKALEYRISQLKEEKKADAATPESARYVLKRSDSPYYFEIASATVKTLQEFSVAKLLSDKKVEMSQTEAAQTTLLPSSPSVSEKSETVGK